MHLRFSQQQQTPQPQPAPRGWRAHDPNPTPLTARDAPMTQPPHSQPVPDPTPSQLLSNLIPWSSGSTSQIFRTVIKLPQLMQMYLGAELDIDAPDVESVFAPLWDIDEERLVEIDRMVPRREETVLFDPKDEDN
ncbi:hypothetical protein FRC04_005229 [Tulasnella sp. 424]|nr:hypothetical protein FRC04_005229 [Tulasnella sp. 424]KAG8962814.1 hypothetical protein FRC05_005099 [Tulasnella sp. 425]